MSKRPLFVKVNSTQKQADTYYTKVDGDWKEGRLVYRKVNGVWEHEHEYQDQVWLAAATCQNGTKYQDDCPCGEAHGAPYYSGPVDPDNHTGVQVYGGTALSHIEYSCCGLITSAIHTYGNPSYTWNQTNNASTTSCIGTAICDCTYKKQKAATISINSHYAGTCQAQEKWDYKAVFNDSTFTTQVSSGWQYGDYDYSNHTGNWRVSYTSHGYESGTHTRREYYDCCDTETGSTSESCGEFQYTVVQQPTCGEPGVTRIDCGLCDETFTFDYYSPPPTGNHNEGQPKYEQVNMTSHKKTIKCTTCGQIVSETYEDHEFSVGTMFTGCINCGYIQ